MSKRTFDDFDEFASGYRDIHTENVKISGVDSFYFAKMKIELLQEFEKRDDIKLLDFGCGDGTTEKFINEIFPGWHVEAIDISEKSVEVASEQSLRNVTFNVFDGINVPFASGSFDIVFVAGVLHHVDFNLHPEIIKEISRVLKVGGRLYLFEHNPLNPLTRYLVRTCVFDKDAKLLPGSYTTQIINSNGLQVQRKNYIIFFPRKWIFSKLLFLEKWLKWVPLGGQYFIRAVKPGN